jgi:hypothetical protein
MLELGVVVPTRGDASHVRRLLAELEPLPHATEIVVVDNGLNGGDMLAGLPQAAVLTEPTPGAAHALTAGCRYLTRQWTDRGVELERAWILVLDADCSVGPEFLSNWARHLEGGNADVRCGSLYFEPIGGEPPLPAEVRAAWAWMWKYARWLEGFVGVVNTATNHATRASLVVDVGYYVQPTEMTPAGEEVTVAGVDWDFGLRCRLSGGSVSRKAPGCRTSVRRILDDPAGFLTGRAYESRIAQASGAGVRSWPPAETWPDILDFALARFTAHYLLKPALVRLPVDESLRWFLGEDLSRAFESTVAAFEPPTDFDLGWVEYRRGLISTLFSEPVFELCRAVGHRLQGSR